MTKAYQKFSTRATPQTQPIPGTNQTRNAAGGYTFTVDKWGRLTRFLILGSDGGTYYASPQAHTLDNATNLLDCIKSDGLRVVQEVVNVSVAGRAPKNDPALFALALAVSHGDVHTKAAAYQALPKVCRIGTHLFTFLSILGNHQGLGGNGLKRALARWYNEKDPESLLYQVTKYGQRGGFSQNDVLQLAHPVPVSPEHYAIFRYVTWGYEAFQELEGVDDEIVSRIDAIESLPHLPLDEAADLIRMYNFPREVLPTEMLNSVEIWDALLENMPVMAMVRNLGKMTSIGLTKPMSAASKQVVSVLQDAERLAKSRVHPIQILYALKTYGQGQGVRGKLSWNPVPQIVGALDDAFELAFGHLETSGKRHLLGIDVSGSMGGWYADGGPDIITPREGAAAMAMVTARTEPEYMTMAFSGHFQKLDITPKDSLQSVIHKTSGLSFDMTDCSLPMRYALENGIDVDTFVVYTDNETYAGRQGHPSQWLQKYRDKTGIPAKLIVVAFTGTHSSIADPNDAGMLDVVGFDTATPNIIAGFSAG